MYIVELVNCYVPSIAVHELVDVGPGFVLPVADGKEDMSEAS